MADTQTMVLSNGQSVYVPNIRFGVYSTTLPNVPNWHNESYYYYQQGQNPATFVDLSGYAAQCDAKGAYGGWNDLYAAGQYLRTARDESYYEEGGAGKALLDALSAHSVWLWGGWNDGGVFMIKTTNGRYHLASFMQLYRDSYNQVIYHVNTMSSNNADGLSLSELSTVAFTSHENIDGNRSCDIDYLADGRYYKFYLDYVYSAGLPVDTQAIIPDVAEAMAVSDYNGYLGVSFPARAWRSCNESGVTNSDGWKQLGRDNSMIVPTGFNSVGGSVWDNAAIDGSQNPYANTGGADTNNGDPGSWPTDSDPVDFTDPDDQFATDAINSGFFTLYNPTKAEVKSFNDFLFSGITESMSAALKKLIADPLDYMIFISMCHFTPISSGTGAIQFCGIDSGVTANIISKQQHMIDCGSLSLRGIGDDQDETNSFMSYEPYIKLSIFLPYIGTHELKVDDFMGGDISVVYFIDLLTGSCIAQVKSVRPARYYGDANLNNVVCSFTGNVYQNLPLTATDWRGLFSSVVQFAGGLAQTANGNAFGGIATMAQAVFAEKVSVARTGQIGANYGYMDKQKPFLILSRPKPNMPVGIETKTGFPTYEIKKIGMCSGYTEIDPATIYMDNFDNITDGECDMIKEILATGFVV